MSANDGGPAFPREDYDTDNAPGQRGMSLRDYLAGQVAIGYLAAHGNESANLPAPRDVAGYAYRVAEAMLQERAMLAEREAGS